MEAREVADFRECILEGHWEDAEEALTRLCVTNEDEAWVSCLAVLCRPNHPDHWRL